MSEYQFLDRKGTFTMECPENTGYLYFPIAGENGLKGAVTPTLGGDLKVDQNTFLMQPASVEDLMESKVSRNFWCILEDGSFHSATGASAKAESQRFTGDQEKSRITAGLMWQTLERSLGDTGLVAKITSFVPTMEKGTTVSDDREVMYVQICNTGSESITLTPVAAIPIYGRSADNLRDHRHVTSLLHRIYTTDEGVFVKPTLSFDERGHQVNDLTYYVTGLTGKGEKPVGFCPVVEDYTGEGGSYYQPKTIVENTPYEAGGKEYAGYEAIGAIKFDKVTIPSGEEVSYIIRIGVQKDLTDASEVNRTLRTGAEVEEALAATKEYWLSKVNVSYHTSDAHFDDFMFWVNFQPILRRIYGCSFLPHHDYGKGGRGWRDLWQDCLALLIMNPDGVRQMLIDNYGGVRMDGSNATIIGSKQGEFIADRNNITRVWMDHGFWPLLTTKFYIDQTGDLAVLLKDNSYFKDRQEMRGTATDDSFTKEDAPLLKDAAGNVYKGTLLEHILIQNMTAFYEVGEHNHMRLRGADWNDALDMAEHRGESVAFTAAYSQNLYTLAELIEALCKQENMTSVSVAKELEVLFSEDRCVYDSIEKKTELLKTYCKSVYPNVSGQKVEIDVKKAADCLRAMADWIQEHIRKTEWIDNKAGGWFNSYYDDNARKVEGITENGVRMMLTGQVFSIMSGTATKEQTAEIVKAADQYLYEEKIGGYRLNSDFKEVKKDFGRAFGFAFGHKENGAVFSHMTTMYGNALYKQGFVREGYKALHTLYKQSVDISASKIYPGIPEYFNDRGRGMYNYLTGAASWLMMTVITQMFGVRGEMGDLLFAPKLLKEQFDEKGDASVRLQFAGKNFEVCYHNAGKLDFDAYKVGTVKVNKNALEAGCDRIAVADIAKMTGDLQVVDIDLIAR